MSYCNSEHRDKDYQIHTLSHCREFLFSVEVDHPKHYTDLSEVVMPFLEQIDEDRYVGISSNSDTYLRTRLGVLGQTLSFADELQLRTISMIFTTHMTILNVFQKVPLAKGKWTTALLAAHFTL